jgi:2-polyprenyl-6-methoxyphenol hydroxylase-like FAD-dependent oxidoreductase
LALDLRVIEMESRPHEPFETDVLIVGAGPIGLVLANLLGARRVRTLVCDHRTGPPAGSMAIGVTPPSLEILKPLGLDTVLREAGIAVRHAEVHEGSRKLGRLDFAAIRSEYPFFLSIPQVKTMEILRDNLRQFPSVEVRDGAKFTGLEQDYEWVTTRCSGSTEEQGFTVKSRFVVGCDGHRSIVREATGLTVREKTYPQRFIMADFEDQTDLGEEARLFFTAEASVESFPLPGGRRRWILQIEGLKPGESPVEHLVHQIKQLTGYDLLAQPDHFVSTFGAKRMVVERYHRGRVILAGDAAHVMSPIGGQGMNTGFADAEMLAEILPSALRRMETLPSSLAAYDRIRRAAFEIAATRAERGMWLGTLRGRFASLIRRVVIQRLLFSRLVQPRLAPHFAMLTIPGCNLDRAPCPWLVTE